MKKNEKGIKPVPLSVKGTRQSTLSLTAKQITIIIIKARLMTTTTKREEGGVVTTQGLLHHHISGRNHVEAIPVSSPK